jgi:hypothetical protein
LSDIYDKEPDDNSQTGGGGGGGLTVNEIDPSKCSGK